MAVGDDHRARRDRVGDVVEVARGVAAAAEQIPVPAAVVIAVDVRIARVVVAVVLGVDVRLLERERPRTVVLRRMRAVGGIAARHVAERRRREVRHRRADAERRRPAVVVVPVVAARRREQHRRGGERRFDCEPGHGPGNITGLAVRWFTASPLRRSRRRRAMARRGSRPAPRTRASIAAPRSRRAPWRPRSSAAPIHCSPSAIVRIVARSVLPDRVFGSALTTETVFSDATGPTRSRTSAISSSVTSPDRDGRRRP